MATIEDNNKIINEIQEINYLCYLLELTNLEIQSQIVKDEELIKKAKNIIEIINQNIRNVQIEINNNKFEKDFIKKIYLDMDYVIKYYNKICKNIDIETINNKLGNDTRENNNIQIEMSHHINNESNNQENNNTTINNKKYNKIIYFISFISTIICIIICIITFMIIIYYIIHH